MDIAEDDGALPWAEPGVYRTAPDVYRIPLPMQVDGLRAVNCYVLTHGGRGVLVDPGVANPEGIAALEAGLAAIGLNWSDIAHVLVTHYHYDHYSAAVALRERHDIPVRLGAHEEPSLRTLRVADRALGRQAGQLRLHGHAELADTLEQRPPWGPWDEFLKQLPDRWITDGEDVVPWAGVVAVHTPGHTHGHVCFHHLEHGLLFSGDHVLPTITPSISFEPGDPARPLRDYLDSLRLVRSLPETRLLPAHGPVTTSSHRRAEELLTHHEERFAATLAQVDAGARNAAEVARRLRWTSRDRSFEELDALNQMLAVTEIGMHLEELGSGGRLRAENASGVQEFMPLEPA